MQHLKMPLLGLGTWQLKGPECTKVVEMALDLGYRYIDTASVYENHFAIAKALEGTDRKSLFLSSKIALAEIDFNNIEESVYKACEKALKELKTDYLDVYYIHWPDHTKSMSQVFKTIELLIYDGMVLKGGVSNFTIHHLKDLQNDGIIPSYNQVEFHPHLYQKDLLHYLELHHIKLVAHRPFGKGALLQDPFLLKLAHHYNKSPAQIILRWLYEKNIPTIPKASSFKHLQENLSIFDFSLTPKDTESLDNLKQTTRYCMPDAPEFSY